MDQGLALILTKLNSHKKEIVDDIKAITEEDTTCNAQDTLQWIREYTYGLIGDLLPIPTYSSSNWKAERDAYANSIDKWVQEVYTEYFY